MAEVHPSSLERYKGKAKCSCGKRAKWRIVTQLGRWFSCPEHLHRIKKHDRPTRPEEEPREWEFQFPW